MFQFADDLLLLKVVSSVNDLIDLQNDLNKLSNYCAENNLLLSPAKSEHLRLTLKKSHKLSNYIINGTKVSEIKCHKHIGVWYDAKLTFNNHCDFIISKALRNPIY